MEPNCSDFLSPKNFSNDEDTINFENGIPVFNLGLENYDFDYDSDDKDFILRTRTISKHSSNRTENLLSAAESVQFENGTPVFNLGLESLDFDDSSEDPDFILRRRGFRKINYNEQDKENYSPSQYMGLLDGLKSTFTLTNANNEIISENLADMEVNEVPRQTLQRGSQPFGQSINMQHNRKSSRR